MSFEKAKQHIEDAGLGARIKNLPQSSATVALAAEALGCEAGRIAKTLSFLIGDAAVLIVAAGDAKIDNGKFKAAFCAKPKMVPAGLVEAYVGHKPGGVCPFGANRGVGAYLDISLKRFDTVYPACGNGSSAVELTVAELESLSASLGWVDVCGGWNPQLNF